MATISLLLGVCVTISSCVYRFTNSHIGRVPGMRTVAIESIYDTSRESMPHEVIWEALQRAFAADGHMRVVSRTEADVLIRAHIVSAAVTPSSPTDSNPNNLDDRDPEVFQGGAPPKPKEYKRLTVAREQATKETSSFNILVEAWQMQSGKLLLSKTYSAAPTFNSLTSPSTTLTYSYIRHEEAIVNQVDIAMNQISAQVVQDFLLLNGT